MGKKVVSIISLALFIVAFGNCFAEADPVQVSFELPGSGAVEENGTDRPIDEEGIGRIKVWLSSPQKGLGSEGDGPLLFFEPPEYKPLPIAEKPGGFISLWTFEQEGRNYAVASTDFKPGFKAENCRIIIYPLEGRDRGQCFDVGKLPFTHRVAVLGLNRQKYFLGSTLCSAKAFKQDWTQPGGIHLAVIPDRIAAE
jgi:hypothetical protein